MVKGRRLGGEVMVTEVEGKDESKIILCTEISFISKSQIKLNTQQRIVRQTSREQEQEQLHFLCLYLCLYLYLYHVLLVEVMQPAGGQDQPEDWHTVDALVLALEQKREPVEAQGVKRLLVGPDQLADLGTGLVLVQMPEPVEVQGQVQEMPVFSGTNQIKQHTAVPNEEANCCKWEAVEALQ